MEICLHGLNFEKLLNKLCYCGLCILYCERRENFDLVLKVKVKDKKKCLQIINEFNYEVVYVKNFGMARTYDFLRHFYGLYAGIIVAVVCLCIFSGRIFIIDVIGVSDLQEGDIVTFITQNFSLDKNISTKEVEYALCDEFDKISFVSCLVKGQTLIVNIKERVVPDELNTSFEPIVATCDCKIQSVNLVSGTLCVGIGDIVKKGDVLVEPYVVLSNGESKSIVAKAEIVGVSWLVGTSSCYLEQIVFERTGNFVVQNHLQLFGMTIYSNRVDIYDTYESETKTIDFCKNLIFPFKFVKTCYYETKQVCKITNYEQEKEYYINTAKENALQNLLDDDIIIDETYTENSSSGVVVVSCVLSVERVVSGLL